MKKIKVNVIYDTQNKNYSVMNNDKKCLKYGTSENIDAWLFEHSSTHEEVI